MLLPPIPLAIKLPVASPLQATFTILSMAQLGALRLSISAEQIPVQPFTSVTVIMKFPGPKLLMTFPLTVPAFASKVNGEVPPNAVIVIVPSLASQSDS